MPIETVKIHVPNRRDLRRRVSLDTGKDSRAKQSFKKECDINTIVATFAKTGVVTHLNHDEPNFGFAPSMDLKEAFAEVEQARKLFGQLPSEIRRRFGDDLLAFVEFAENEANLPELQELGLLREDYEAPKAPQAAPAAENPTPSEGE